MDKVYVTFRIKDPGLDEASSDSLHALLKKKLGAVIKKQKLKPKAGSWVLKAKDPVAVTPEALELVARKCDLKKVLKDFTVE